jgi:hypothetical protein
MVLKEYNNIYTRTLFVAVTDNRKDLQKLVKDFTFCTREYPFTTQYTGDLVEFLANVCNRTTAFCSPVIRNSDNKCGIMCIIPEVKGADINTVAHEATHITDYFYQSLQMDAQDYSEGNEPYAYLVGWAAENIHKTCCEYETKLRRVKNSMGSRKNGPRRSKKRSVQQTDE